MATFKLQPNSDAKESCEGVSELKQRKMKNTLHSSKPALQLKHNLNWIHNKSVFQISRSCLHGLQTPAEWHQKVATDDTHPSIFGNPQTASLGFAQCPT